MNNPDSVAYNKTIYEILGPGVNPVPAYSLIFISAGLGGMFLYKLSKNSRWKPRGSLPPAISWILVAIGAGLGLFYLTFAYVI